MRLPPVLVILGALCAGCGDDGPSPGGYPRPAGATLPHCEDTEPAMPPELPRFASTVVGRLEPTVAPLERAGALDPSTERGEIEYFESFGFGEQRAAEAWPRLTRTDLGGGSASGMRSIAWFVHYSDLQLADDETPARYAALDSGTIRYLLRPQDSYTLRALSALNRVITETETRTRPFDFGIVTGDCTDSAQQNELDWFILAMNGLEVEHDSGEDDDPVPGEDDAKDPFLPAPFPAPWLYVPGNHDIEVAGRWRPREEDIAAAVSDFAEHGTRDYREWFAPVVIGRVPADPRRAVIDRTQTVAALRADTAPPGPSGHGYGGPAAAPLRDPENASYAWDPMPGLLRILALDTTDPTGGTQGLVLGRTVDEFLRPELDRARTDGILVMLASHHAIHAIDRREDQDGPIVADSVEPAEIESLVASYPNVIAWLVGHNHAHQVQARGRGPGARGFWQIMTASIADAPSQARVIELVDRGGGELSILTTMIDWHPETCIERRTRRLMLLDWQSGWRGTVYGGPEDTNLDLRITLPPDLATLAGSVPAATPATPFLESP